MRFLTQFSLRNPVVVIILTLLIAIGGALSASQLKEELLPDISLPVIAVVTTYPGASPGAVAHDVTDPLEKALHGLQGVQDVVSTSVENVSEIELQLSMTSDISNVQQKVQQTVSQVALPSTASQPSVQQFSFNSQPIVYLTVSSQSGDSNQLRSVVQNTIVPALQGVAGVGSVSTTGAQPDNVVIQFDASQLQSHNLTVAQVIQDLQADNLTIPVGTGTIAQKVQPVQLMGAFRSLAAIRQVRIPVQPSATAGLKTIGSSLQSLGSAVGALSGGLQQVGQGLTGLQAENQLLAYAQEVQGQLLGASMALVQESAKPIAQQDPAKLVRLEFEVKSLQDTEQKLLSQLQAITGRGQSTSSHPTSSGSTHTVASVHTTSGASTTSTLATIPLSDVATVSLQQPKDAAINRTNGAPSVLLRIIKTDDANTVTTAHAVNAAVQTLQASLPGTIKINTLYDSSVNITQSIDGLVREAILGALFAAIVILLFLRNALTTLIAIVSIPVSLLTAMIFLNEANITLNIMTLGGMAVATGRVVDDSIVVIENIYRTWRRGMGFGRSFVRYATGEVGQAITSSTITTIAVFLPLGFVSGVVGKIFLPFALTVVFSLISSLIVSLTIVPMLAYLLIARKRAKGATYTWLAESPEDVDEALIPMSDASLDDASEEAAPAHAVRPWQAAYQNALRWSLNHKGAVIAFTLAVLVASIAVLPLAGSTFIPESTDKYATVNVTLPTGATMSATLAKSELVEHVIQSFGATVQQLNTQIGYDPSQSSPGQGAGDTNTATMTLQLQSSTNVKAFVASLRTRVAPIAGTATLQIKEVSTAGSGGGLDIIVTGPNYAQIVTATHNITESLRSLSGLTNLQSNLAQTRPQVNVTPDLAKAAQYNVSSAQIAGVVRNYLTSQNIGTIDLGNQQFDMQATVKAPNALNTIGDIASLPIATPTGQNITVGDVATVSTVQTPVSVLHRDGQPYAEITGDFTTSNTGKTTKLALSRIANLHLPSSVQTQLSGSSQQQNQSFTDLIEAVLVAAGLVYVVMLIAFGEWSAPFAILFSMPVALIGAFFGTVIGHQPVSISTLIGILMLMGIVVTNAIVLVARVEQQRRRGMSVRDSLIEAGTTRLRPIMMTAIATICALAPLAAGLSEGALISQGLAVVVIGGLVTSTILTLVIVPIVYELLHRKTHKREQAVRTAHA